MTTIIDGFASTAPFTLGRRLDLRKLTFLEISTQVVQIVVMLTWAYFSPTIWALAAAGLVSGLVNSFERHSTNFLGFSYSLARVT